MRRSKRTYAIFHLTEKHTAFYLGKMRVQVSFTGGIITKKGVTPATFTTEDPVVQLAIESSDDFRRGVIRLKSEYPLGGDVPVGVNPREVATTDEHIGVEEPEYCDTPMAGMPSDYGYEPDPDMVVDYDYEAQPAEADSAASGEATAEADESVLEVLDASCKDVAKQYLEEHFGENPAKLRTRDDVQRCAAKYGIRFNFV